MRPIERLGLTKRDREFLVQLFWARLMTADQILHDFFPSVSRRNTRLKQLITHRLVRVQESFMSAHGMKRIFSIGPGAVNVVQAETDAPIEEIRRIAREPLSTVSLEHTLRLVDLKAGFLESATSVNVRVVSWLMEAQCRHEYSVRTGIDGWKHHIFKPDALGIFSHQGVPRALFIELDLGNVSKEKFALKVASYEAYQRYGMFSRTHALSQFEVLVVTTSMTRLRNLSEIAKKDAINRYQFATLDEVTASGPFSSPWREPRSGESALLLPNPEALL